VFGAGDNNQIPEHLLQQPSDVYGAQYRSKSNSIPFDSEVYAAQYRSRSNSNPFDFVPRAEQSPQTQSEFDPYAFNLNRTDSPYIPGMPRLNQYAMPYGVHSTYMSGPGSDHGSISVYSNNQASDSAYHTLSSPSTFTSASHADSQLDLDPNVSGEHLTSASETQNLTVIKPKSKRSRPKAEKPQFYCDAEGCDEVFRSMSSFSYVIL
jgi:hypothetical protein